MSKTSAKWIDFDSNLLDRSGTSLKIKQGVVLTDVSASFSSTSSYVGFDGVDGLSTYSSSVETRLVAQESFSSSLDSSFVSEAEITALSSSLTARDTVNESAISDLQSDSGSFSTRVSTNESAITDLQSDSGSLSTRVSTNESDISDLQADSGSLSTRVSTNETDISNLQSDSGSFSTRVTDLEEFSSSLDATFASEAELSALSSSLSARDTVNETAISDLVTDSGSFSTRVSTNESDISDLQSFSSSLDNIYVSASGQDVVLGNIEADVITANELHITFQTSSVIYTSGSTKFGDTSDDTHEFTGSIALTGSGFLWNGNTVATTDQLGGNVSEEFFDLTSVSASGVVTLASTPISAQSVTVSPVGGPIQANSASVGSSGVTPDFWLSGTSLYFNNNGIASGLSGDIDAEDVIIVKYNSAI